MSNECWKPSITLNNLATRLPNGADAFELKSFVTQWISWNVSATYTSFLKPAQWAINRTRLPQPNTTEHQNRQTLSKQTRHRIQCPRATSKLVRILKTIPKNDPALSINRFCKTNKSTLIYFETSPNIPKHTLIRMNVVSVRPTLEPCWREASEVLPQSRSRSPEKPVLDTTAG